MLYLPIISLFTSATMSGDSVPLLYFVVDQNNTRAASAAAVYNKILFALFVVYACVSFLCLFVTTINQFSGFLKRIVSLLVSIICKTFLVLFVTFRMNYIFIHLYLFFWALYSTIFCTLFTYLFYVLYSISYFRLF